MHSRCRSALASRKLVNIARTTVVDVAKSPSSVRFHQNLKLTPSTAIHIGKVASSSSMLCWQPRPGGSYGKDFLHIACLYTTARQLSALGGSGSQCRSGWTFLCGSPAPCGRHELMGDRSRLCGMGGPTSPSIWNLELFHEASACLQT